MLNYVKLKKKRKKDIIFYVNAIRERDRFLIKENKVKKKKKKKQIAMVERDFRMFGNFNPSEFPGRN